MLVLSRPPPQALPPTAALAPLSFIPGAPTSVSVSAPGRGSWHEASLPAGHPPAPCRLLPLLPLARCSQLSPSKASRWGTGLCNVPSCPEGGSSAL